MAIDYKTANHICNVIRRQIQGSFPDLYLHFVVHQENERKKAYERELSYIVDHSAAHFLDAYLMQDDNPILNANKSGFAAIARDNNPGFMGLFQHNAYLGICFVNHDRFKDKQHLKNQALHMTWKTLAIHQQYIQASNKKLDEDVRIFDDENNILSLKEHSKHFYQNNLKADIFAASVQMLQDNTDSLKNLSQQRINATLSREKGFIAENFPFSVCLDTLEFIMHNNLAHYKKNKKPVVAALDMTEEVGKTYEKTSIKHWHDFSNIAQYMAWAGHKPSTILGAALYTNDDTHVQSIADLLSDHLDTAPQVITTLPDYNPFASPSINKQIHMQRGKALVQTLVNTVKSKKDLLSIVERAERHNKRLRLLQPMGWCGSALIKFINALKYSEETVYSADLIQHAEQEFNAEFLSVEWKDITRFSHAAFEAIRMDDSDIEGTTNTLAESDEAFFAIHHAFSIMTAVKNEVLSALNIEHHESSGNITDFISPNAVKKSDKEITPIGKGVTPHKSSDDDVIL